MKLVSKEVEEVIKAEKRTVTGVRCDICGKSLRYTYCPNSTYVKDSPKYFEVTTGHHDWGNDSHESIERMDVCPECIIEFVSRYLSEAESTEHINVETHWCWAEKVDVNIRSYDDRRTYKIDEEDPA